MLLVRVVVMSRFVLLILRCTGEIIVRLLLGGRLMTGGCSRPNRCEFLVLSSVRRAALARVANNVRLRGVMWYRRR